MYNLTNLLQNCVEKTGSCLILVCSPKPAQLAKCAAHLVNCCAVGQLRCRADNKLITRAACLVKRADWPNARYSNKAWTKIKSSVDAYYRTQCHWRILLANPLHVVRELPLGVLWCVLWCSAVSCGVLRCPVVFRHTACCYYFRYSCFRCRCCCVLFIVTY